MSNRRTNREEVNAIFDSLTDSLLDASDAEIIEEARLESLDPTSEARRVKALMLDAVRTHQQRVLREARREYDLQTSGPAKTYSIPKTPAERRDLFSFVLKQPQYAELLTAQHRELTELTDRDIESYLQDLDELGVLEKLKPDVDDGDA